ncbi:sugar ABC transporter substrate-binding protein [Nocardia amamiensis]|uniref:sugar ABC transporter substrate-binding protein n=1 Tax=Nocardia amamiensis TaxID=404578 RepID=UPI00248126A4|nr:sugar ABC transporter substrate-binding protein [Nocardia amamiensis]
MLNACAFGAGDRHEYTVGVVLLDLQDPDLAGMAKAMKKAGDEHGIGVELADSKKDNGNELNHIEDLITKRVDAVILQPLDGKASQIAAKRVIDAGIPLFIVSTEFAEGADIAYKSYIGIDDTLAGEMQGKYLNEVLPEGGDILFVAGTYGASWTDRRKTGFARTVARNINVVSEFQANGSRDDAKRIMEDTLSRYARGSLVAVVAQNDESAIGAASAIAEAGRRSEFKAIIGIDGTADGVQAIADGQLTATVQQDSAGQGTEAVRVVAAFLNGGEINKRYELPFNLITQENVAKFK